MIDYSSSVTSSQPPVHHPSPEDCMKILQILDDGPHKQQVNNNNNNNNNTTLVRRRKVHFASEPSIVVSSDLDLNQFTDQLWYQRSEINEFKAKARQLVLSTTSKAFRKDDSLRGLESSTMERRLHRHKTIQCTLSAYKKHMNPEDVAKIARVCATWNTEIAFVQACKDYYTVYPLPHNAKVMVPKVSSHPPAFPFALRRRAKSRTMPFHHEQHNSRRVRRRVA